MPNAPPLPPHLARNLEQLDTRLNQLRQWKDYAAAPKRIELIEEMEALWAPIAETDDWTAFNDALGEIEEMRQAYAGDAKSSARPGIRS